MSFEVKMQRLEILPHPNADALELAKVGGFHAVIAKGVYRTGDWALYIPEAAVLPEALIEELGLTGKLAGSNHDRVKAVRLRGQLSQGIVCRPLRLGSAEGWQELSQEQDTKSWVFQDLVSRDWADFMGITKWVPPIPAHFEGTVFASSRLLPWGDIVNINSDLAMFEPGELVEATEKVHGTCCLVTFDATTDELLVSSKGMGKKGQALVESTGNVYWRAVRAHGLEEVLRWAAEYYDAPRVGLFGEVFGKGIQDLGYDTTPVFRAFDMYFDLDGGVWSSGSRLDLVLNRAYLATEVAVQTMPILYSGFYDYEALCAVAQGDTVVGGGTHIREGVVVRPMEARYSGGSRVWAKFINPDYLLRKDKNATEFE